MAVLYSPFAFAEVLSELGRSKPWWARVSEEASAAFGRLCVETLRLGFCRMVGRQPPSGGCVLKLIKKLDELYNSVSRLRAAVC